MSDLEELLKEEMEDEEFRKEWEASEAEYQIQRALIKARIEAHLTQKQLAEKIGIRQSNISRIESGACVPTIETLRKIAVGAGKRLKIDFV